MSSNSRVLPPPAYIHTMTRVVEMESKFVEAYDRIPLQCIKDIILNASGLKEEELRKNVKALVPLKKISNFATHLEQVHLFVPTFILHLKKN